ncbi:MAG TPA: hypothetical protein VFK32_01320, partial [Tepidiformaceae bacterium]|nr:hypothetical protein [Tepidiformaceae bacterium]
AFAQALHEANLIRIVPRDFKDWIFMPNEPRELIEAEVPPAYTEAPRYDYTGFVYTDLTDDERTRLIIAIHDERHRPGTDWLTFNRAMEVARRVVSRDDASLKNLISNMLAINIMRFDQERAGRDPATGTFFNYKTIALDLQHRDVRTALKLGD